MEAVDSLHANIEVDALPALLEERLLDGDAGFGEVKCDEVPGVPAARALAHGGAIGEDIDHVNRAANVADWRAFCLGSYGHLSGAAGLSVDECDDGLVGGAKVSAEDLDFTVWPIEVWRGWGIGRYRPGWQCANEEESK